jgi:hypothetical protein
MKELQERTNDHHLLLTSPPFHSIVSRVIEFR